MRNKSPLNEIPTYSNVSPLNEECLSDVHRPLSNLQKEQAEDKRGRTADPNDFRSPRENLRVASKPLWTQNEQRLHSVNVTMNVNINLGMNMCMRR